MLQISMRFPGPENRDQNNTSTIVRLTQIQERYFEFSGIHFEVEAQCQSVLAHVKNVSAMDSI